MDKQFWFLVVAAVLLALLPLVPKMVAFRIKVLDFLHLSWLADWHQRYSHGIVIAVRITLTGLAILLVIIALTGG